MKRLLLICMVCLSGCTFYKHTIITAKGDKLSVPLAGVMTAKGEKVDMKMDRIVCVGNCEVSR